MTKSSAILGDVVAIERVAATLKPLLEQTLPTLDEAVAVFRKAGSSGWTSPHGGEVMFDFALKLDLLRESVRSIAEVCDVIGDGRQSGELLAQTDLGAAN